MKKRLKDLMTTVVIPLAIWAAIVALAGLAQALTWIPGGGSQ